MRYAQITDGKVVNVVIGEVPGAVLIDAEGVGIGWTYDGTTFIRPAPNLKAILIAQIETLEAQQTPRRIREAALGTDNGWLADLNNQIAALRAQLV